MTRLKYLFSVVALMVAVTAANAQEESFQTKWGDQGDGTYINPVLNADYSDPDVIRVGKKYYMVASDFHFMGMQVLESDDMVNWKIISQIYDRFDLPMWDSNMRYAGGSWAPSIRYHDKKFWVYFCTPHEGLFMSTAENPEGPWSPLHCVKAVEKWEDPCPLWDDDGQAYLAHSLHGAGPIIIHKMSSDGKELLDEGVTVYRGPVAEGPKFLKKDGWYYISIPEGGVTSGWQTVLRSRNIYGPYENKRVLETGTTAVNGPHQGSLVETREGEWWFYHFQETHPLGRVVHLQPASWKDGWPVIGVDYDGNDVGEPVHVWKKPAVKVKNSVPFLPQSSDDFEDGTKGLQWQWNHNPHDSYWSLTERDGWLTIHAQKSEGLAMAHNMLTQKCMGFVGTATTRLDLAEMADGQRAGLLAIGNLFYGIGVLKEDGKCYIYVDDKNQVTFMKEIDQNEITLSVTYDANRNIFRFAYGKDKESLVAYGPEFSLRSGFWKGARVGLYTYNILGDAGKVHFDDFDYPIVN